MRNYNFHIVKSIRLRINHSLLAKPGTKLKDVKEIFSHEQAIGQCGEFLKTLKDVKITICENTARAAKIGRGIRARRCCRHLLQRLYGTVRLGILKQQYPGQ